MTIESLEAELGFRIEERAGSMIRVELGGGVGAASWAEISMWNMLLASEPEPPVVTAKRVVEELSKRFIVNPEAGPYSLNFSQREIEQTIYSAFLAARINEPEQPDIVIQASYRLNAEFYNRMAQYFYEEVTHQKEISIWMPMTAKGSLVNCLRRAMRRAAEAGQ